MMWILLCCANIVILSVVFMMSVVISANVVFIMVIVMAVMWEGGYPRAPDEDVMAFQMQRYMTNFAKTGNPNEAGLPPWPAFTPSAQEFLEFADGGAAAGAGYHARQCDAIDPLVGYVFQKCGAVCRTLFRGRDRFHEQWTPGIAKLFGQ